MPQIALSSDAGFRPGYRPIVVVKDKRAFDELNAGLAANSLKDHEAEALRHKALDFKVDARGRVVLRNETDRKSTRLNSSHT